MNVKSLRHADEAVGNFRQPFAREAGVDFILGFVAAVVIRRPIFGQFAKLRSLSHRARLRLFFFVLPADLFRNLRGIHAGAFGVDFPEGRVILNALVQAWLGDCGVIDLAVAVTAVADDVDNDLAAKRRSIFRSNAADAHTASGSSALTWKIGTDWRLAMSEAKREECSCVGRVVKPIRLFTMM